MAKKVEKYVKCEVTGEFIPESQSETVQVDITKKKGIPFKIVSFDEPTHTLHNITKDGRTVSEPIKDFEKRIDTLNHAPDSMDDVVGKANANPKKMERRASVIPPAFKGLVVGPESPDFETKGEKIIRKV